MGAPFGNKNAAGPHKGGGSKSGGSRRSGSNKITPRAYLAVKSYQRASKAYHKASPGNRTKVFYNRLKPAIANLKKSGYTLRGGSIVKKSR